MTGNRNKSPSRHSRFTNLMAETGLTGAALADRIGVARSTVSSWATGKVEPPGVVLAYLSLLAEVKRLGK